MRETETLSFGQGWDGIWDAIVCQTAKMLGSAHAYDEIPEMVPQCLPGWPACGPVEWIECGPNGPGGSGSRWSTECSRHPVASAGAGGAQATGHADRAHDALRQWWFPRACRVYQFHLRILAKDSAGLGGGAAASRLGRGTQRQPEGPETRSEQSDAAADDREPAS